MKCILFQINNNKNHKIKRVGKIQKNCYMPYYILFQKILV